LSTTTPRFAQGAMTGDRFSGIPRKDTLAHSGSSAVFGICIMAHFSAQLTKKLSDGLLTQTACQNRGEPRFDELFGRSWTEREQDLWRNTF
jgi:hypothetical protein